MTHRFLIGLGWAVCAVGFGSFRGSCSSSSDTPLEQTSSLTYALQEDGFVTVQLDDPTERLFLRAHLELPEGHEIQQQETVVYGMRLDATKADGSNHSQELWLRSRVSLNDEGGPSLTGPIANRWITDGRHIELDVADIVDKGGQIELRPLLNPPNSRLFLRIERRPNGVQMRLPWLGGAVLASRTGRFSALPWTSLTREEIERIWSDNRRPVSAIGLKGDTVELARLSAPNLSPFATTSPVQLKPGQSTALTLQGPCSIEVDAKAINETGSVPAGWTPTIERIQGRPPNSSDRISSTHVDVPTDALWTIQWTAPLELEGLELSFQSKLGKACVWGQGTGFIWDTDLSPETRRFTAWSLGQEEDMVVPVASGSGRGTLVIEARPHFAADYSPSADSTESVQKILTYAFEDGDGRVLQEGRAAVEQSPDPFDRKVEPYAGWMGQVTRVALQHPPQATQVRLRSDSPVDLRFLVPLPVEEERASVYALPSGWTAQNAPWDLAPYVSLTPLDSAQLLSDQRLVRFDSTVRPRKVLQSRPEGHQETHALIPNGQRLRYGMLDTVRRPGSWKAWHRTELGRSTRLKVPPTGAIKVDYRTTASEPGTFQLTCNGQEHQYPLNAGAGSFRLSGLAPDWNLCRLSAPAGDYFVDSPGSGQRWARRGLYRLSDSLEVEVDVPVGGTTVFIRVYTENGVTAAPLSVKIDGGRPRIRSGAVQFPTTPTERRTPQRTGRTARLIDNAEGLLQAHRGIGVTFGDDLLPGRHVIDVSLPEGSDPIFVRFDSSAASLNETRNRRHWYVDGGEQP